MVYERVCRFTVLLLGPLLDYIGPDKTPVPYASVANDPTETLAANLDSVILLEIAGNRFMTRAKAVTHRRV